MRQKTDRQVAADAGTLYRQLFEQSRDAVAVSTPEGRLIDINAVGLELFGFTSKEEMLEVNAADLYVDPGDRSRFLERLDREGYVDGYETHHKTRSGEIRVLQGTTSVVRGPDGEMTYLLSILRDVTEQKRAEERLVRMARYDTLTQLANRATFTDHLDQALARACRFGGRMAVMMLDLDHFKCVNDSLGHRAGDALLVAVSRRLERLIRKVDTLARFGGDELAVIKTDFQDPENAAQLARRLVAAFDDPFEIDGHSLRVSASIGISLYPPGEPEAEQLVRRADLALYRAKAEGRSTYRFYDEDIGREVELRMALARDLNGALARGELFLEYQPQVDLADQRITGVEALLRWRHPDRGLVGPARFIAAAESSGLIHDIGQWVLDTACDQVERWQRGQPWPLTLAVNLSGTQLRQDDFVSRVASTLERSGLEASSLELELTESVLMSTATESDTSLDRLHDLGVRLSLDNFGTGYSSLEQLRRFPLDRLKIDPSFLHRAESEPGDAAIVGAVIALARKLALKTVAAGIETRGQVDFIASEGCYQAQGFYLCPPLPAEEVGRLLSASGRSARA